MKKRIRIKVTARDSNDALRLLRRLNAALSDTEAGVDAEIDMAAPPNPVVPADEQLETHVTRVASNKLDELARAVEESNVQSASEAEIIKKKAAAREAVAKARERMAALGIAVVTAIAKILSKTGL